MLMNNLDPDVAEHPEELVVYGGIGRAARDWVAYDKIVETLRRLEDDETLLIQSGKPVGVFKTHADAPRVLLANSNLVPHWATWEHFDELDRKGLMMYGQMTAGSWIYIGTQGIVQGTYETFAEMGRKHFGGDWSGKWILTAGLGGMGGAQPLAAVMAGACCLAIECQSDRIDKRLQTRYLDKRAETLDEALKLINDACAKKEAISVGLLGNAAEILPEMVKRGIRPDAVTDQTSAHDLVNGYLPAGWTRRALGTNARAKSGSRARSRARLDRRARESHARLITSRASRPSITATTSAKSPRMRASKTRSRIPASCRPTCVRCSAAASARSAGPRSRGDPDDIAKTDAKVKELIPNDAHLHRWLDMAKERIAFQGLPARICWVGLGQRHRLGLAFNEMVAKGEIGPLVIGRDHLDSGSVASPNRETEKMRDGSDAVSRLAAAQRAAQHRRRRNLGVAASRRRRRHGLFAAQRRRHRLRRHRSRSKAHRPRALERSRHRRHAPRRRRLRRSDPMRERAEARSAVAGVIRALIEAEARA